MTRHQFSLAVNADEKWVENTGRLLGRRLSHTQREAQWLGLVRVLNHELGLTLARSAQLATEALRSPPWTREVRLGGDASGSASIAVDLARYHSTHIAAMSAALTLAGPRKRGRPSAASTPGRPAGSGVRKRATRETTRGVLARAKEYGVDLDALRDGLRDSPAERLQRLEENARFVSAVRNATVVKAQGRKPVRPRDR